MSNTRDLTQEEMLAFKADMDSLLEKHNCEIGVVSQIHILKRGNEDGKVEEPILSPFLKGPNDEGN